MKVQGTLLKADEDAVRDRTDLLIRVRTTKLQKLGVHAKAFVDKDNALTISFED